MCIILITLYKNYFRHYLYCEKQAFILIILRHKRITWNFLKKIFLLWIIFCKSDEIIALSFFIFWASVSNCVKEGLGEFSDFNKDIIKSKYFCLFRYLLGKETVHQLFMNFLSNAHVKIWFMLCHIQTYLIIYLIFLEIIYLAKMSNLQKIFT